MALPGSVRAQAAPVVRFETSRCTVSPSPSLTAGKDYYCGFLTVPQTWGTASSKTIRLAVLVIKARGKHPSSDPIIYLYGGPGLPTVQLASAEYPLFYSLSRDLILVDQRGTGLSQPSLACPEVDRAILGALKRGKIADQSSRLYLSALKACRNRLVKSGIDLNAYTISQDAADIAALRTALGYKAVNLFGVSYGTALALEVMRSHPTGIRSVVLDSVVPPTAGLLGNVIGSSRYALTHVFASCAASKPCNRSYPHLRTVFLNLVTHLDHKPVTLRFYSPVANKEVTLPLSGAYLGDAIASMLTDWLIATVPSTIWQTAHGNLGPITDVVSPHAGSGASTLSVGMQQSVLCAANQPYPSARSISTAEQALPAALRPGTREEIATDVRQCKLWNVRADSPVTRTAVHSSIPTLILEGEFDPVTPPPFGDEVARTLDHSFHFVFPGASHGVAGDGFCPHSVVEQFVIKPTQKPDASCISEMSEPAFQ